jgi:hypothetical protein
MGRIVVDAYDRLKRESIGACPREALLYLPQADMGRKGWQPKGLSANALICGHPHKVLRYSNELRGGRPSRMF